MKKGLAIILVVLSIITLVGCGNIEIKETIAEEQLIIHFIDVGQADSILIQLPNRETVLIDGGNRADADLVTSYIKEQNINKINYIIATHPHEDHIGGLPEVIKEFDIGNIYMPNKTANTKIFKTLLDEIKKKNLKVKLARGGESIINTKDIKFNIIAPNSKEYDETNEYSIVNKLIYKNTSFLFTGDAEKDSENEMVKLKYDLSADLLKVGHHGGVTSTNDFFLEKVNPKYAVISVGKDNRYGHPHEDTIKRLNARKIQIYRTDELGIIKVISDGENIVVE